MPLYEIDVREVYATTYQIKADSLEDAEKTYKSGDHEMTELEYSHILSRDEWREVDSF